MKAALSRSVREDGQVKTDDASLPSALAQVCMQLHWFLGRHICALTWSLTDTFETALQTVGELSAQTQGCALLDNTQNKVALLEPIR